MPQSLTMKRLHQRLIQLLLVSLIIMWFFNIQSVCFIDYSLENTEHLKHPLIQTNPSNNTSPTIHEHHIYNPILIPSNNKKYHLKHQLAQELEPVVTIYPNHTFAIHQDISSYLSFALIGLSKTGTTSLLKLLSNKTAMLPKERCDLVSGDIPILLNSLHDLEHINTSSLHRGIKCPQDIWSSATSIQEGYKKYFYKTKLIIGLRHPVLWFESLYNFNVRNANKMAPTHKLKRCVRGSHGVCAWRMNLADFMSWLNKTPMGDDEKKYMSLKEDNDVKRKGRVGSVFLYEVNQMEGKEKGITDAFLRDLAEFLDIKEGLSELPHISTAGSLDFIPGMEEFTKELTIDICDDQHSFIRKVLVEKARTSSEWIRTYFLKSKDVHVSSKDYFVKQLEHWGVDPCIDRRRKGKKEVDTEI